MTVHRTNRTRGRLRRIVERSMRFECLPHFGRAVPEYAQPDLREVLERPCRIVYRVGANGIDVITVMHYRELLPDDLDHL